MSNNASIRFVTNTKASSAVKSNDQRQVSGKEKRKNGSVTRNIIKMVIASLFVGIICQVPFSVCFILNWQGVNTPLFNTIFSISVFFILLAPILDIFIYYFFNKLFKTVVDDFLKKKFKF